MPPVRALMPQTVSLLSLDRMTFDSAQLSVAPSPRHAHARPRALRPAASPPVLPTGRARQGSSALPGSCASHHLERGAIFIVVQVLRRK